MGTWLVLLAVLFSYLAYDAWRVSTPSSNTPYQIEVEGRGESVAGVSVSEQLKRWEWHRHYGIGQTSQVVWLWVIIAAACYVGAAIEALR
jgi:hypothetical protein